MPQGDVKQLERSSASTVTYRWWRSEGDVLGRHIEALEESAKDRIREMMAQGYTSGQLCDNVHMTDEDGEDGIEYTGWWESSSTIH